MAMHAKAVLVDTVDIMVFAHVDTVAVMVGITAPDKVVIPQSAVVTEPTCKEGPGA